MSAKFTAWFGVESFEIEITSDGELVFPGWDIEYDITFAAMGGDKTAAVWFSEEWGAFPMCVIYSRLGVPLDTMLRYMADLQRMSEQVGSHGVTAMARSYMDSSKSKAQNLINHMQRHRDKFLSDISWKNSGHFHVIAHEYAMVVALQQTGEGWSSEVSENYVAALAQERSRQVRHFVRIMEAIQAGKEWPEIEELS